MPTKLSDIDLDPNAAEWDDEEEFIDPDLDPDAGEWETDAELIGVDDQSDQAGFDIGTKEPASELEPDLDPNDIWSDPSFTGQKPKDDGPSFLQSAIPMVGRTVGGPFLEAQAYAITGTDPYRPADTQPDDWEGMKALVEGYKSLTKGVSRGAEMLTRGDPDTPDVDLYDLGDPLERATYQWDLLKSEAYNGSGPAMNPIFDKLAELDRLQPDIDYYERLENKPKFSKYMEEVVGMAPQMASQVAAHAVGGPVTSGIWMALQIAGSEYDNMIDQGMDPERAYTAAWSSALMQAPMEMLSLGIVLRNPVGRRLVKGGIAKFAIDRVVGGATEFLTETFQKVPSLFWENWAQNPEYIQELKDNPEKMKALVTRGLQEGMKEGWIAAFYGAILGSAGDVGKPKAKVRPKLGKPAKEILAGLQDDLKEGTLTADDIKSMQSGMDSSHPLYDELGALVEEPAAEAGEAKPLEGERLPELEGIVTESLKIAGNLEEGDKIEAVRVVESKKKKVRQAVKVYDTVGLNVIVYKGKGKIDGFNGMMDTETGQIYLNENADDPHITVLGHESLHRLKKSHPDLYSDLVEKVKDLDIDTTAYLKKTNKNRKAAGVVEITAEQALGNEEFIADFIGYQFGEKDFWQKVNKSNPTLGKELARIIKDLVEAIKSAMRKNKSVDARIFKQMNDAQDAAASVYGEFARREAKITEPAKPAKPAKPMTAEEKAARAEEMPLQVEFDHIAKGLSADQRVAAADIISDTKAPIRERLVELKALIAPAPAKKKAIEDLTNEEIAKMSPEQRAKAVLGPDATKEEIAATVKQIEEFETKQAELTPQQQYDALAKDLTPAQKKDKAIANILGDKTMAVDQRMGLMKNAIAAYDKAHPEVIKKAKQSKAGLNVRTLRGAILAAGGIKWGDQFKGERKNFPTAAIYLTRQKSGMPWDTLEKMLRDDGWLGAKEKLVDILNDAERLTHGRVNEDILEKKADHLTEQEKEAKAQIVYDQEEPPPGDYMVMNAEDLPEGKKLTLIEDESTRGWDVYEVVEKDPFGITLKDGITIELSPKDKVQVRKADIAASVKRGQEKKVGAYTVKREAYSEKRGTDGPFHDIWNIYDADGKKVTNKMFSSEVAAVSFASRLGKPAKLSVKDLAILSKSGEIENLIDKKIMASFAKNQAAVKGVVPLFRKNMGMKQWNDMTEKDQLKEARAHIKEDIANIPEDFDRLKADGSFPKDAALNDYLMLRANDPLDPLNEFYSELLRRKGYKVTGGAWDRKIGTKVLAKFSVKTPAEQWYSKMERALAAKLPNKGTPASIKGVIQALDKKGDFKSEELEWSEVEGWLDAHTGKVTKQEVLDYLAANAIVVKEVFKSDANATSIDEYILETEMEWSEPEGIEPTTEDLESEINFQMETNKLTRDEAADAAYENWQEFGISAKVYEQESGWSIQYSPIDDIYEIFDADDNFVEHHDEDFSLQLAKDRVFEILEGRALALTADDEEEMREGETPKFEKWQMPGGRNYQELVLRLPAQSISFEKWNQNRKTWDKEPGTREEYDKRVKEGGLKVQGFTGGHYDETNVLVHIRFNERINDAGENILFIEEIQSDWHQRGRKEGYRKEIPFTIDDVIIEEGEHDYKISVNPPHKPTAIKAVGKGVVGSVEEAREYAYRTIKDHYEPVIQGVPDAPFKTTWPMLAMKRMVRYAAENEFDKIAWTPGEVQADRYDLSKQVSKIVYLPEKNQLLAYDLDGGEVIRETALPENLEDYIGKEAAKKLIESPVQQQGGLGQKEQVLEGLDLKVGGEGMKSFYDKMLVNEVNKFFNKAAWGKAKVGVGEIATRPEAGEFEVRKIGGDYEVIERREGTEGIVHHGTYDTKADAEAVVSGFSNKEVWTLPITKQMRKKAMVEGQALFAVKSYKELGKPEKNAFNRATRNMENGEDIRKRVKKHEGTAWVNVAFKSVLLRQAIEDVLDGKATPYENALNDRKSQVYRDNLVKLGENGIWSYLGHRSLIGAAKKPLRSISGSFAECDPSKKCAGVCYAATGRRNATIFIKAESVNWGIEKDPIRAAKMAAAQYEILMDFDVQKALRMFDRGEAGSKNWTIFINELNKRGVRTQIFSKRAEFIRSVSDMNIKMLSIDSSNTELADANPDLPLAVIYEGEHDIPMLEKYKDRIAVILPIIYSKHASKWNAANIAKMPAWTEDIVCPVDAGSKKVGQWNCTKCDSMDGLPGCFYGASTAKILDKLPLRLTTDEISYRVEDLRKHDKGMNDARARKRFNDKLDLLVSQIRGGRDPGAAEPVEESVSEIRERAPGNVPGRRGTEKGTGKPAKGQIADEDITVEDTSKVKFSPKFAKPGQMELPIFKGQQFEMDFGDKAIEVKHEKPKAKAPKAKMAKGKPPKKVKSDISDLQVRAQRTRMATTGWLGSAGKVVRNVDEAASLLAPIRKSAQEQIYTVVTDKSGLVLEIQRYSKGIAASAPLDPNQYMGHILRINDAARVYFVHNHPSTVTEPSAEDAAVLRAQVDIATLKGIEIHGLVIGGTSYLDMQTHQSQPIKPILRTMNLPVKERYLVRMADFGKIKEISNSKGVKEYLAKVHNNAEGFLFLESKLKPVGFLSLDKPTTMKAMVEKILKAQEDTNARGIIFNSTKPIDSTPGRRAFLRALTRQLGDALQLFEVIEQGVSYADTGQLHKYKQVTTGTEVDMGQLGLEDPLYSVKAPGFYTQIADVLEKKLGGKGTVEQFRQLIDRLAGPPTRITREISTIEKVETKSKEIVARLKELRKEAGTYKGEYLREELEWSGLEDYFKEQVHPDLETYRALRGLELTKDMPGGALDADTELKLSKQINADYDAMIKKPFKIKKANLLKWLRVNNLEVEEVHYRYSNVDKPSYFDWPVDAGDKYEATWENPLDKKKHNFYVEKVADASGQPAWYLYVDNVQKDSPRVSEEAIRSVASDWADSMFEESLEDAAKLDWAEKEGAKVPTWVTHNKDPLTGEYVEWEIKKQKGDLLDQQIRPTGNYTIYMDGDMWDDTAGHSLAEAMRYVSQEIEDAFRDSVDRDIYGGDYLPAESEPQHETWTMKGGKQYQEVLLKLPVDMPAERAARDKRLKELIAERDKEQAKLKREYKIWHSLGDAEKQKEVATESIKILKRHIEFLEAKIDSVMTERDEKGERTGFKHPHWPGEKNVVAFARFNIRIDDKGRTILFLEEVQSDWHQTGREEGYYGHFPDLEEYLRSFTNPEAKLIAQSMIKDPGSLTDGSRDKDWETLNRLEPNLEHNAIHDARDKREYGRDGVPDAPFKKSWPLLVMKRMVRWAAKEGYDAVSWTPGMIQINRYEEAFRKQVDKISWYVNSSGKKVVSAKKDGKNVGVFELDEKGIASEAAFPSDAAGMHITNIIGKKLGSRAMQEEEAVVAGKDLTIGGEGMKEFYDKRLVNAVNKFFGKNDWGNAHVEVGGTIIDSQVGEEVGVEILTKAADLAREAKDTVAEAWLIDQAYGMNTGKGYSMALFNPNPWPGADKPPSYYFDKARKFEDKYQKIWTLPMTPQMHEKSLEEGMPLFSVKKALQIPDTIDPMTKDYRVTMSVKKDHPGFKIIADFNAANPGNDVRFDGEWDRSEIDMDPMYQFTIYDGPAKGATFVTETLDPIAVETKFIQISTPIAQTRAAMSAKNRIDPITQTYIDALKAAEPTAFVSIPDIGEDPASGLPKEVAERLDASKGLGRLSFFEKMGDTLKDIWHSSTRHRPYLDPKEYSDIANVLRIHQEVPSNSARRAGHVLSAIMGQLKPNQYKVFAHKLLMDDMSKDVESGLLEDPENLPFGFNIKTAREYLAKLNAMVEADPVVKDAIERRELFNNKLKRALVDAKLLPETVMEDDRYFHHQVLQYRAVKEIGSDYYPGIGVSSKDVRLKKKGWQRGRIGSIKDYNSDYAESEFEVVAQAIAQLETKATMERLQELADIMPALKTQAKSLNLRQLYINEAARQTKADKSGRIWTAADVREEADPLKPFGSEIAKGLNWIGNLAKKGKLENGTRDFTDVLEALEEWQRDVLDEKARAKDDMRDPNPIPFPFDELGSRAWAYFNHMMTENLEGAPAAGIIFRAIRQRNEFIKEYLGHDFKTAKDIMPDDYTTWVPAPGTSWYKAHSLSDRIVDAVQAGEMVIGQENAEKIKQILARGRDIEWIVPTDVAKTLDGYDVKLEDHMLSTASRKMMTGWKQWILINPYRVVKYNLNNMSGDLDIALAYDPKIVYKYFGKAARDIYKDWKSKKMTPELKAELDLAHSLGVVGSGWSVQEVADVGRELAFDKHMQALTGEKPNLIKRGWRGLQGFTNYRENILRLAAFRYFQTRLAAGDKNIYGASNKAEIDGIADNTEKAAKLARELIGDYGNITHSGQWLRRHLIPFYSWLEVNAPRYVRLMRNLKHEGQGAKKIGRALPLVGASVAWKGSKLAMKATAIYVLVNLWNRAFFPDEEEELGEAQRRQLHIIFGRREDGTIISLRFQGALSDAMAWFGGEDIAHDVGDVIKGKVPISQKAKEAALAPVIKIISGIRPDVKSGAELLAGQSFWPDPFNPRPIYDKLEHVTRLFSLNGAYGWLAGKPKRGDSTGERLLNDLMALGFYNSDPGESAYYDIKSKTFDFLDKHGNERPSISPTSKSKALYYYKQALKYGDLKAAEKYLAKYLELGGTNTGITGSLKRSAPLGSLPKKDWRKFLATLNEDEKDRYQLALRWYNATYQARRRQVPIPAPAGGPVDSGQPGGGKNLRELYQLLNEK